MRSVIKGVVRGAALVTALAVFMEPTAWAARVQPPVGVRTNVRLQPPGGNPTSDVRIQPPVGVTPQHRVQPPVGLTEMFVNWLRSRLSIPHG